MILMRIVGLPTIVHDPDPNVVAAIKAGHPIWLKSYDIEAFDGRGNALFTDVPEKALRFADLGAAFEAWKTQSKRRPIREDGKPNRPLTAFSITFDTAPEPGGADHDREGPRGAA
jgi:hypothetical protein